MKKLIVYIFVISLFSCKTDNNYQLYAKTTLDTLQNWYNTETGLYETTSWWNAANALTAIIDYSKITGSKDYLDVIDNSFEICKEFEVKMPDQNNNWICKNFINDYYDDEGWWILAWIKAFELTKNEKYLKMARITFEEMALGWDEVCGGGVYWKKPNIGKSAVQNELFMLAAIRLHQKGEGLVLGKSYMQWSEDTYSWFVNSGMINDNYIIENGLDKKCQLNMGNHHTYNQGIILSGLVELYKVKNDTSFLDLAHNIADATIENFVYDNGVLKDPKEPNLNGDASQFKGIFMRNLGFLYSESPKEHYKSFILNNVNSIWSFARNKTTNEVGVVWNNSSEKTNASTQSSALDAFNAAMIVSK